MKISKFKQSQVKKFWKLGKNIWEISQLTVISESDIMKFIQTI